MPSTFLGIYSVLYDYAPQSDQELSLKEGDLLYVLEKSEDDDWWKAKKRTLFVDEDEPEGLVPCNYITECVPISKAKATYDYTRQTQEELSFTEDAVLDVYDTEDPDWTLVGYNGEYGFAPANYIEIEKGAQSSSASAAAAPGANARARVLAPPSPASSSPAPASPGLAPPDLEKPLPTPVHDEDDDDDDPPPMPPRPVSIIAPQREKAPSSNRQSAYQPGPAPGRPARSPTTRSPNTESSSRRKQYRSDSDSDDGPSLPMKRPPHERRAIREAGGDPDRLHPDNGGLGGAIPPGYRSFPVMELIGKKKHAALLALGPERIILIPDKSSNPRQEWSVEHMMNYSYEGKHVFIDVNYPTKAMDLHAGSKEVAAEIYAALADLNGAARANEGLREVISATDPRYKRSDHIGTVLWDFLAGGEDEVSVNAGDEITILDDKDHDWWMVKRTVNGQEGVVPSNYIKRGRTDIAPSIEGRSKETKASKSSSSGNDHSRSTSASLPSGVQLPVRTTSLAGKRNNRPSEDQSSKSKPDAAKLRMWTDRSGTFKVEAQFLGCRDDKIHLHKSNGVKIAVPVSKMSVEDLEYVERRTGISLDDDKPLMSGRNQQLAQQKQAQKPKAGITIENKNSSQSNKKDYDWFDFFLGCGIDLGDCQRYALHFQKESMDETFLPELTASSLRNLGLKEGDIIRATKFLDNKYGRGEGKKAVSFGGAEVISENGGEGASGGLFSGPGGVLRNNTGRKGRPAPAIVTSDTVDPSAFQQKLTPPLPADKPEAKADSQNNAKGGFDDDAWAPKPTKQPTPQPKAATPPPPAPPPAAVQPPPPPPMSAGLQDLSQLSLSTPPLQPTVVTPPQPPPQPQFTSQTQGFAAQQRQRPPAPQQATSNVGSLIPPPPQRPISAPQQFQSSPMAPVPLTQQMTGMPLPSVAPPGQMSMADQLHELRMQQIAAQQQNLQAQQQALFAQMTGAPRLSGPLLSQQTGYQMPQPTGFQVQQPTGFMSQMPIIQAPQPSLPSTGYQGILHPQQTGMSFQAPPPPGMHMGVNSLLPAPLIPQPSGLMQPLKPQATGPAPQIRFGAQPGQPKLAPQPTGKRANLSQATPENPFGF